ncbi:hypothetical protein QJQ45_011115 [Haematococcus lacustris]|nr:hypothetical protein QJQ45_011115 [Haematococcus lacustris]
MALIGLLGRSASVAAMKLGKPLKSTKTSRSPGPDPDAGCSASTLNHDEQVASHNTNVNPAPSSLQLVSQAVHNELAQRAL